MQDSEVLFTVYNQEYIELSYKAPAPALVSGKQKVCSTVYLDHCQEHLQAPPYFHGQGGSTQ